MSGQGGAALQPRERGRNDAAAAMNVPLLHVVELNETAKQLRRYAFEVGLSALGATVRSSRAAGQLRGFQEVATQMRAWSSELALAAQALYASCAENVRLESELVRRTRLLALIDRTSAQGAEAAIAACAAREHQGLQTLRHQQARASAKVAVTLEQIVQLGLMASVLSRAALIEAASGQERERHELSIASQEFAAYADRVNDVVADACRQSKRGSR
ncbi:MAG TPA: hypothetical protein VI299_20180 [Polyangiales bacterium]